jgi:hypothetical protein
VQELSLTGYLGAFAEASLGIVAVGAEGGVQATIGFDLNDVNNDGKMHGREILDRLAFIRKRAFSHQKAKRLRPGAVLLAEIKTPCVPDIKISVPAIPRHAARLSVNARRPPYGHAAERRPAAQHGAARGDRVNGDLSDGDETFEVLPHPATP